MLERLGALGFSAFGLFWVIAAARQHYFVDTQHVSLSFLPMVAGGLLAVLAGYVALRPITEATPEPEPSMEPSPEMMTEVDEPAGGNRTLQVLLVFAALLSYAYLLPRVHALATTFALMVAGLLLSGEPLRPRLFIVAAIVALLLFGIFVVWLGIPVPGSRFF